MLGLDTVIIVSKNCILELSLFAKLIFKKQLLKLIKSGPNYVLFLVDDDIMVRPFWESSQEFKRFMKNTKILSLSLRLSPDYRFRGLPPLKNNTWVWQPFSRGGKTFIYRIRNWGCPMAVGGHIFRKKDILPILTKAKEIKTPNYLEQVLNVSIPNRPLMLCCDKAKFINNEINQVQSDFPQHTPGPTPEELERRFIEGERISVWDMVKKANQANDYFVKTDYSWEKYETK